MQEKQAAELLAGPAHVRGRLIAVGDFNSAADPATTDKPTATYSLLTKSWFRDAWLEAGHGPGLSCCQNGTLSNATSQLYERIDLVLLHTASGRCGRGSSTTGRSTRRRRCGPPTTRASSRT